MHPETRHDDGTAARAGFSLIELLLAITISSVVMVGVLSVVTAESRRISQQRELSDTWLTLRSAAELIAFDLRHASATGGDLRSITASAFTVRSRHASGVICAKSATGYALTSVTGDFSAATGDSVQIMTAQTNPVWRNLRVAAVGTPGTVGPASCVWAGSAPPTTGLQVVATSTDTSNVSVGSQVQAFRSTHYGIMTLGGRSWLGRKVSGATTWEVVTGPLRTGGYQLTYYTSAGAVTTTPALVSAVRITLRAESYGRTTLRKVTQDTLSVRVRLRN